MKFVSPSVLTILRLQETLYNVWHATSELRDLVTYQRISLQQLKLEIKLESILNDQVCLLSTSLSYETAFCVHQIIIIVIFAQMVCLEDWAMLERDHISSLTGAIGDLEANTLRLPLTGGTKVLFYIFIESDRKTSPRPRNRVMI